MALDLEFERGKYQPLVHGTHVDDFEDPVFQYVVVSCAIAVGALNSLPSRRNPLVKISNCGKNYNYIVTLIASFSAQLSTCCRESFPCIFMNQHLQVATHPLTGLFEFANLHCNFV
eukprot:3383219-Rhodomonas_salina.1